MFPLNPKIEKYIEAFSSPEDPLLAELDRYTHQHTVNPQMITGHPQGMFLEILSRLIAPQQILEIGTFTGYGTICLSKGLLPGGRIITIEKKKMAREDNRVSVVILPVRDGISLIRKK